MNQPERVKPKRWTITDLLNTTADFLKSKGCASPRLDAEVLLACALNMKRLDLYLNFDRPVNSVELDAYRKLVRRRAGNEPVAYITGKKEFWSREFTVKPGVLIPRPETEVLVETVLKKFSSSPLPNGESVTEGRERGGTLHGFEFGIGSGAIAVTLLAEIPQLRMTAIEVTPEAIDIARHNASIHGVSERLEIIHGDFLAAVGEWRQAQDATRYDFIVANPPYIRTDELAVLLADIRDFEPRTALDGGADGLLFYRELARFAAEQIKPEGFIAVEIDDARAEATRAVFIMAGFSADSAIKDFAGLERVVVVNSRTDCSHSKLVAPEC